MLWTPALASPVAGTLTPEEGTLGTPEYNTKNIYTVNCEYFVVKIFSDSLAYAKIKRHVQY